ncbi:hypothetical protein D3C73_1323130 [compost metagenome]
MFDVDIRQRYRVAERGAGLTGGDFANHGAVFEDRVVAATGPAAQAFEANELASAGGAGTVSFEGSECVLADEVAFLGQCHYGSESCREGVAFTGEFVAVEGHPGFETQGVA